MGCIINRNHFMIFLENHYLTVFEQKQQIYLRVWISAYYLYLHQMEDLGQVFGHCHLTLCLSAANFVICCWSLQTVWTQIRPDILSGLIWIQTVWHSECVPEGIFLKNLTLKKVNRRQKCHEKLPSMQRVKKSSSKLPSSSGIRMDWPSRTNTGHHACFHWPVE